MTDQFEMMEDEAGNPLDSVEDVLAGHDWVFNRASPEELSVHVTGKTGGYRLTFLWEEQYSAMQFFCEYDLRVPAFRHDMAAQALRDINEKVWLGHFDLPKGTNAPCFRHTSLFRGMTHGPDHIEDLVDIALAECERYYNVFNMLAHALHVSEDNLALALTDEAGQA